MGDRVGGHEVFLKTRSHGGLDLFDAPYQTLDVRAGRAIAQRDARPVPGGVAGAGHGGQIGVGDHAQNHCVLGRDMRPEGPGQRDLVDRIHTGFIHQQARPGIERRFRQLDCTDIVLRDLNAAVVAFPQQIGMRASVQFQTRRPDLRGRADQALGIDDARHPHFGHCLDDARPADARDTAGLGRLGKAILVGPQLAADHAKARLLGDRVDLHTLDGTRRRALPGADLCPFERRPGGRGTGQQSLAVAQNDFGIGADVDDKGQRVGLIGRFGQGDGGRIRPDMARYARQDIDARAIGNRGQTYVRSRQSQRVRRGQREGRLAQFHRVHAQQKVVHDRVADDHSLDDIAGGNTGFGRQFDGQRIQRLTDCGGHLEVTTGIHHGIADPAHQVFAEPDLRVHHAARRAHLAGRQIAQMRGNRCRTEVDGQPQQGCFPQAGKQGGDPVLVMVDGHSNLPVSRSQNRLHLTQKGQGDIQPIQPPLRFQCIAQPFQIARRSVHVWFFDGNEMQPRGRVHDDRFVAGGLAHDLSVDLAFRRHVDHHVALHRRLAAQATTGFQSALLIISALDRVEFR